MFSVASLENIKKIIHVLSEDTIKNAFKETTMRWNSGVKHAELTPAQIWSVRDDGNFGGRSILTPDKNELTHFGVPGMKWGVRTKEYIKTGYNTLKRRQAILKMQRKAKAKAEAQTNFDEGYKRGQRVASNTNFIRKKVGKVLAIKEAQNKQSLSDRAVDKGTDLLLKKSGLGKTIKDYGLESFIPKAKDFLKSKKNQSIDSLYNYAKTKEGQEDIQKAVNYILTGNFKAVGRAAGYRAKTAGVLAGKAIKTGVKEGHEVLNYLLSKRKKRL